MKLIILTISITLLASVNLMGQQNFNITSQGAGGIKLGMTVDQARKALRGCQFKRDSDGEGVALISVTCRKKRLMTLYADEANSDDPINYRSRIEFIEVWDRRFKTADGIHVGMLVSDIEKKLGKVKEIAFAEIESREFVTFTKRPSNIHFRIYGGIFPPRKESTTKYEKGTKLFSIQIHK